MYEIHVIWNHKTHGTTGSADFQFSYIPPDISSGAMNKVYAGAIWQFAKELQEDGRDPHDYEILDVINMGKVPSEDEINAMYGKLAKADQEKRKNDPTPGLEMKRVERRELSAIRKALENDITHSTESITTLKEQMYQPDLSTEELMTIESDIVAAERAIGESKRVLSILDAINELVEVPF